jgi:hypothetical protein
MAINPETEAAVEAVLLAVSVTFAGIYAFGKETVGSTTRRAKTFGLAALTALSAALVEVASFLTR